MSNGEPQELAPVRADEQMDWAALELHLRENLTDLNGDMEVLQFPGGHANLTYWVRFGDRELVVRRPPLGPLAPGAHDMAREYAVLSKLWKRFSPAPRAHLLCEDPSVIGATFFVMDRRRGVVIRDEIPGALKDHDSVERRVSFALVDAMAELHSIDPEEVGLSSLGRPDGFVARQVSGWYKRWGLAKDVDLPLFDEVHRRLEATLPDASRVSIVHNDLKLDNCQFDPNDPDRVGSIFDWDMATLGDPVIDLGTLLGYWQESDDEIKRGATRSLDITGFPTRREISERYASRTGISLALIAWYEAFALWKTAVVLQQIYIRYVRGQTKDERFASLGVQVPGLVTLASEVLSGAERV
ncbi:phosphotransferase family protein [Myxococcota bacterium]|nr:phosphotransferase family protein [Myxococcota bacterium]